MYFYSSYHQQARYYYRQTSIEGQKYRSNGSSLTREEASLNRYNLQLTSQAINNSAHSQSANTSSTQSSTPTGSSGSHLARSYSHLHSGANSSQHNGQSQNNSRGLLAHSVSSLLLLCGQQTGDFISSSHVVAFLFSRPVTLQFRH